MTYFLEIFFPLKIFRKQLSHNKLRKFRRSFLTHLRLLLNIEIWYNFIENNDVDPNEALVWILSWELRQPAGF